MANNSTDIRRLMSLLESFQEPVILEGWLTNLKNKKISRLGVKERAEMAKRLKNEWLKWLGQTGREGRDEDMERFMRVRIGFKEDDIRVVMDRVFDDSSDAEAKTGVETPAQSDIKIARGDPEDTANDTGTSSEPEPDDGTPMPKDLNTKLSDFGKVGIDTEVNDNKTEPGEVIADPKLYRLPNGEWDREKISATLGKMPIGDKLTLGKVSFSRSTGPSAKTESVMEADEVSDILDDETVDALMDASAGHINDEYLLNGPVNDTNDAIADMSRQNANTGSSRGSSASKRETSSSGPYDTQEMASILKRELDVGDAKLKQITKYVEDKSYGRMQESDIDVLARIGYALLRSRT